MDIGVYTEREKAHKCSKMFITGESRSVVLKVCSLVQQQHQLGTC